MTQFIVYPELDDDFNFPPAVRDALANSPELNDKFAPRTGSVEYIEPNELAAALSSKLDASAKGQPNGVAGLDGNSKVPDAQLPSRLSDTTLDGKYATKNSPAFTGTPTGITKTHVGLSNVDNTSDANKPVSVLQQAAIDAKFSGDLGRLGSFEAIFTADNMAAPLGSRLTIPTNPVGGQTTHPSLLFFPEKWNGYSYWLAHTPYPAGDDNYEDPSIVVSQDGITWTTPPGLTNPIVDETGLPAYHSDVDLKMGPDNTMYLFYRWYQGVQGGGQEEQLRFMTSTNGVTWSAPQNFYVQDMTVRRLMSPSLIYEDGAWTMWAVDILPSPNNVVRLRSANSSPMSTWSAPTNVNVGTMQSGKEAWHIFVLKHGGRYYGLLNDCTLDTGGGSGEVLFIASTDGLTWTNSGTTVIPKTQAGEHDQLYRSTMVPAFRDGQLGFRVIYTGWLNSGPTWNLYRTFLAPGAWKSLTLANAWVSYVGGGGYRSGLWYKKVGTTVTVAGTVKSGAVGTDIATLPVDFAPVGTFMASVNAAGTLGQIQLFADTKANATDDRKIRYFQGTEAPSYMPINIKFEVV
jgi:hypothetical protein